MEGCRDDRALDCGEAKLVGGIDGCREDNAPVCFESGDMNVKGGIIDCFESGDTKFVVGGGGMDADEEG